MSASPTDTSEAAMARIKRNITWPSGCPHRLPAATNASPAAFNITSIEIRIKIRFFRVSTPINPSTNNTAATIDQGIVNVTVGVALSYPAEFIVINLSQWTGGSNAVES